MPHYEGSDPARVAELHDQLMDRLVTEYTTRCSTTAQNPQNDLGADLASGKLPERNTQ
jgi:hypothetical protein